MLIPGVEMVSWGVVTPAKVEERGEGGKGLAPVGQRGVCHNW